MTNFNKKTLIAYYSRSGQNYVGGNIVNLPVGNTKTVAMKIQEIIGGDLFEIDTLKPYPKDYNETTDVAMAEKRADARPELTKSVENMDQYNEIYLGYPNWWGTFPMAVFTFLESYDLSGKTIIPFCTHEGSGLGKSESDIRKLCPSANVKSGLAIRGSRVNSTDTQLEAWLKK